MTFNIEPTRPAPPPPPSHIALITMLPNYIIISAPVIFLILYILYRIKKNPLFLKLIKYSFVILLVIFSITLFISKSGILK